MDPRAAAEELQDALRKLESESIADKAVIRERVLSLVSASKAIRALSRYHLEPVTTARSARARILAYLLLFVKEPISADELAVVSGIKEYGRRIRELRVEHGYRISTGLSRDDLRPDQYVLEDSTPDQDEAKKWKVANTIRRQGGSGESRALALLKHYVGKPLRGDELAYVAKISSWRRRTGQLRTEKGWRLVTRFTGRPDLNNSEYALESLEQLPPHDRSIEDEVYSDVLRRDANSCQRCSWNVQQRVEGDRKQFIEVHHVEHHMHGGTNNKENLVTLCNVCHDLVHKEKVLGAEFWHWLKKKDQRNLN